MGDQLTPDEMTSCQLEHLALGSRGLALRLRLSGPADCFREVILQFHTKLAEERTEYAFETRAADTGSGCRLRARIDLRRIPLKSLTWDVFVRLESGVLIPVYVSYRYRLFLSFLYFRTFQGQDGCRFLPGNTKDGMLCFQYRMKEPQESPAFHVKEMTAWLVYHLAKPWWDRQGFELVYEKFCMMAQDNGYYYFLYCMQHPPAGNGRHKICYVIDRQAPDRVRLSDYQDNVVDFLSLRHMIYLQAARLLISTDTRMQCYAIRARGSVLKHGLRKKPFVFLQHGVTALKKVDFFYGKGQPADCNLFIVTSEMEKRIVEENFGYRPDEIANCGFARWDVLKDCSQGSNEILIMPTWRTWLENADEAEFKASDYYTAYRELLDSPQLDALLQKAGMKAVFYLHSKFRAFLGEFTPASDRIRLVPFGEIPANELLMRCRMLVTDYSSVCWDVFYLDKPVVFYQFDRDKYLEAHGSYLDMDRELIGPAAFEPGGLIREIRKITDQDYRLSGEYEKIRKTVFPRQDTSNCKRIAEAIRRRWP